VIPCVGFCVLLGSTLKKENRTLWILNLLKKYSKEDGMQKRMKLACKVILALSFSLWLVVPVFAGTVQLPKTGQTISYGTGDDGAKQAGVAWPNPRFTDNNNGAVTDNLTGLIWLKNPSCFNWQPWASALNSANTLASGACGLSDGSQVGQWRLPNRNELKSLVDLSHVSPALPAGNPFTNVQSNVYWTSNTYATLVGGYVWAWGVDMTNGGASSGYNTDYFYVWPVRGGQ
jgi:hypothetical protein